MADEVMAAPMEFSLKYCFDIADISQLQPGDAVSSSCPPTNTMRKGRSVVYSPGGFPLHFSPHLIYEKWLPGSQSPTHRFLLHLGFQQPSDVPYLPPFRIRPVSIPSDQVRRPMHRDGRLLGPLQTEVWGFRWRDLEPWLLAALSAVGDLQLAVGWELPGPGSPLTGELRFQLLDEPVEWSCLPPDMISAILRELPLADRVSARLVCQTWSRILDTDSRCWSNVTHVQSIGRKTPREEPYGYDHREGGLNQVQDHNLYKALGFLTSRKATIGSLELDQDSLLSLDPPTELSQRNIKLKALLFHGRENWYYLVESAGPALLKLIESQPSLERVHLECVSIPIPRLVLALPRLRILSLRIIREEYWEAFRAQPPQLSGLDGFRVAFTHGVQDYVEIANISSIVEGRSRLRRVDGFRKRSPYGYHYQTRQQFFCGNVVVWGTESLSPASAALLLMPDHYDTRSVIIKQ